jgi:sporulation protein YlmC with PRC-barrel domain
MAGRTLFAGLHLLDRQLVDRDGRLCGKVDDLELTRDETTGRLHVSAVLAGPGVLAQRFGRLGVGPWLQAVNRLVFPARRAGEETDSDPTRIPFQRVVEIGNHVDIADRHEDLATWSTERWVRDHVVSHIPGSRHRAAE